ncbi:MAG: S8 family serine peptidase, partial [Nitrospinota bacterium]
MVSSLFPIFFLLPLPPLQEPAPTQPVSRGRAHVVVQMTGPGVDLDEMAARRKAGAGHEELLALAAALHEQAAELHRPVMQAISRIGGTVLDHFWMVNALEAEIPAGAWDIVAALPGVERVEPVLPVTVALKQATDANNHDSDGANLLAAPGGAMTDGTGVTLAIIDTGVDMNTSGTGRPHRAFFADGDPANTSGGGMAGSRILSADDINLGDGNNDPEDHHGHGTSVAGIAAAADWNTTFNSDDGVAPRVWIRVFRIDSDNSLGSSDTTTISNAFQKVVTYPDVVAANMSFSGIPNPDFLHNRTMDRTVKKFDVAVVLAAGNSGNNTLQAQGVLNAMTVGAVSEGSHNLASFSTRGPLNGRTYPLIVAQGQSITTVRQDAEGSDAGFGGTSGAAPIGTGAAALVRQAAPSLTAGETNAILMNTTGPAGGDPDGVGEGYLRI